MTLVALTKMYGPNYFLLDSSHKSCPTIWMNGFGIIANTISEAHNQVATLAADLYEPEKQWELLQLYNKVNRPWKLIGQTRYPERTPKARTYMSYLRHVLQEPERACFLVEFCKWNLFTLD